MFESALKLKEWLTNSGLKLKLRPKRRTPESIQRAVEDYVENNWSDA